MVTKKGSLAPLFFFFLAPGICGTECDPARGQIRLLTHHKKATVFCWISPLLVYRVGLAHKGFVQMLTGKRWDCVVACMNLWIISVYFQGCEKGLMLEDFSFSSYIDWSDTSGYLSLQTCLLYL